MAVLTAMAALHIWAADDPDTAKALNLHQLVDNMPFFDVYPFRLLVRLCVAQRDFGGLSGSSWNVVGATSRFRYAPRSLTLDTPYQEIVFPVQNTESFSELLEATIPSGSYDFILNTLFPGSEVPEAAWAAAKGNEIQQTVKFRNPHVRVGHRVDEKKVTISVNAELEYSASGHVVHRTTEERRKDLVQRFGQERLLDLVRRIEGLRAGGRRRGAVANG